MERSVRDVLAWYSFEAYLPVEAGGRLRAAPASAAVRPLFPGYVFCHTSLNVPLRIVTLPGVVGFVGCRGVPVPVLDEELQALRQLEKSNRVLRASGLFHEGQKVRVCSGALEGLEGWVRCVKKRNHLIISVDFLKSAISVSLEGDCLEPA